MGSLCPLKSVSSTVRLLYDDPFLRAPFPSMFPISSSIYLRRLRLFSVQRDMEDKKERCSRRRYVASSAAILIASYSSPTFRFRAGRRESYEAPFGRSRGDPRISSSPHEFCFNFRVPSCLRSQRAGIHVKLLRGVTLITRAPNSYPRASNLNWSSDKSTLRYVPQV